MGMKAGEGSSLKGISTKINGRHAFIHERVLELVARETQMRGSVQFHKTDLARRLGCCVRSLDHAVTRLRRDGFITSTAVYDESGGQLGNEYRATPKGVARAAELEEAAKRPAAKPKAEHA